jgi:hypothetical protein
MENFIDFFDVNNVSHLEAYNHLSKTGTWPEGFVTEDMEMPKMWLSAVREKMADAYVLSMFKRRNIEEELKLANEYSNVVWNADLSGSLYKDGAFFLTGKPEEILERLKLINIENEVPA